MASAIPKRDNLIRLMHCLAKSCTKGANALVLHYLALAKPSDIEKQEWNIDEYLNHHRDGVILQKFIRQNHKKEVLFPGHKKNTNIDHWDLATLFTVLGLFQNIDADIIADMTDIRILRNKLFHWGSDEMSDTYFVKNKGKIEQFVKNCCIVIDNESIKNEVAVILEDMEVSECIEKTLHTKLENWIKNDILDQLDNSKMVIMSTLDELHMKVRDIYGIEVQHMPEIKITLDVTNCNKETSSKVTGMLYENIRSPPPECKSKLWDAIDEVKQKFLCEDRKILETCKACVILTVQCPDFKNLKSLLEECLTGKLTAAWKSVENILRHLYTNDKLTLEFIITNSDFWCCIEELVEKLTTSIYEQVGVDILPDLSPGIMVHPSTAKGSGTGVSAVPITIKPYSYRHALKVSDVIQSGSLDEDFQKISTLLADIYGMNDVTIAANLETTERETDIVNRNVPSTSRSFESKTICTSQCDIVDNQLEKSVALIRNGKRKIKLINAKEVKEMTGENNEMTAREADISKIQKYEDTREVMDG